MVDRALAHQVPHALVVADAGYGDDAGFRAALRRRGEAYVLGVDPSKLRVVAADVAVEVPRVGTQGGRPRKGLAYPEGIHPASPRSLARRVRWERVEWAEGTKGPLAGQFHRLRVRVTEGARERRHATDEVAWLLLEKRPRELKAYLGWGLDDLSLGELVAYAHLRWTIELYHREAKQLLGLDRFEGRTWRGWHHHVAMVQLAYAFLSHLRAGRGAGTPLPTLPEVARAVVLEVATQELLKHHRLSRRKARGIAATMVRSLTQW
jgi:SRSO17 transposase